MTGTATTTVAAAARRAQWRAFWLRQLYQWHWISAALSLVGMLLFAITGITLNHASQIKAQPQVQRFQAVLPPALLSALTSDSAADAGELPPALQRWLTQQWSVTTAGVVPEWSDDEVYLSLPRPGGDGWLSIERASGAVEYERTDRGWVSYLNDLHKGRHTGGVWTAFLDVFAIVCLVFAISGLLLLQMQAARRPSTWPLTGLGLLIPLLLALLFIH